MTARRSTLVAVAAVLVGAGAVAAAGYLVAPDGADAPAGATSDTGGSVKLGQAAPVLAGPDPVSGRRVALRQYRGRPVVLHVWASWCGRCEAEAPALKEFARAHPRTLLGLNTQDTDEDAEAFYERHGLAHPSIFDPDGRLAARLGLTELPTTLFLNEEHLIVARVEGPVDEAALERGLAQAGRG